MSNSIVEGLSAALDHAWGESARLRSELNRRDGLVNSLQDRNRALVRLVGDYRDTIEAALRALRAARCETCAGAGEIEVEVEGYGSIADETPPTYHARSECEDCAGIGLDWSAAHEGAA
jgi:hypothetical protein